MEHHEHGAGTPANSSNSTSPAPAEPSTVLESASLPANAIPFVDLFKHFAPASITVPKAMIEDGIAILSETIFRLEDSTELDDALEELLRSIAAGEPLTREAAASITPTHGDLFLREVTSITAAERKLNRDTAIEFELDHSDSYGCVVSIARGPGPETVKVTVAWREDLQYQSSFAIENRWQLIEDMMPSLSAIYPEVAIASPCGGTPYRYALADGLTIDVVPGNERYADLLCDPHPALRPDLIYLCALRARFEEDEERLELDERIGRVCRRLATLCPDISIPRNYNDGTYTREALEECGPVPFLAPNGNEVEVIVVDNFILIATRRSTGNSLLADLEHLERLSASVAVVGPVPALDRLKALETTIQSAEVASKLFVTLDLPSKDYFIAALSDFVNYDEIEHEGDLIDGLLFALRAGKPVTVTLSRQFIVEGSGPGVPAIDESRDPWEAVSWQSGPDPDRLVVSRFATVSPTIVDPWVITPAVGFITPQGASAAEALASGFLGDEPVLGLSVPPNRHGEQNLPEPLVRHFLALVGHVPGKLPLLAAEDDPVMGERTGYLSDSVRLRFSM